MSVWFILCCFVSVGTGNRDNSQVQTYKCNIRTHSYDLLVDVGALHVTLDVDTHVFPQAGRAVTSGDMVGSRAVSCSTGLPVSLQLYINTSSLLQFFIKSTI